MIRSIVLLLLTSALVFGQSRMEFEVASIRQAADQTQQVSVGLHIDGAQVRYTYLSLKDYIGLAYRVKVNQIIGPDWIASQRFDIAAKLPDGGLPLQVPEMLQTLLADRFKMKMHRESRDFPVYALEVAKTGLKIKGTPVPEPDTASTGAVNVSAAGANNGVSINLGNGAFFTLGEKGFELGKIRMPIFADMLTRFMDRPVVDMTSLKDSYDFQLDLSPEDRTVMMIRSAVSAGVPLPPQALRLLDAPSGDSIQNAMQKVGLSLDARKAPLEVLVIDDMQKTPTEN